jgi:nucleoside 2-deoxyribosyltransferase
LRESLEDSEEVDQTTKGVDLKIYLAGPMTGLPNNNKSRFRTAKSILEHFYPQHEFINPHDLEVNLSQPDGTAEEIYRQVLPGDVATICECGAILVLPGFEQSRGTALEQHLTELIGIPILRPAYDTEYWANTTLTLTSWLTDSMSMLEVAS